VAVLLDTTAAVLLLRRKPPQEARPLLDAALGAIAGGTALLPAVAAAELLLGERRPEGAGRLRTALSHLPVVVLPAEAAAEAGSMGGFLASVGASVPLPDLLIAATALWLGVPLLTWDSDFPRSVAVARGSDSRHPGAEPWRALRLHPASIPG